MRKTSWIWMAAALAVASFGCKKEEPVAESTPAQPAAAQPPAAAPAETKPAPAQPAPAASEAPAVVPKSGFDRALLRPAMLGEIAPDSFQVKFSTTRGDFTVTVTRSWAPVGADRFYNLVKHHFYDNSSFFRVVPGFVAQFGISAYPPVSAAWQHADIKDEPVLQSNKRGYLTYAKTPQPNTRGTQLFINLKDNSGLDREPSGPFAPFGVVDGKGMNVVDMLYDQYGENGGPDQDKILKLGKPYLDKGWPKLDSIKSVTLVAAPK